MKKKKIVQVIAILLAVIMLIGLVASVLPLAFAASSDEIQEEIDELESQAVEIKEEIDKLQSQIDEKNAEVFSTFNFSELAVEFAKENCNIISMEEHDESLEAFFISLIGGEAHA